MAKSALAFLEDGDEKPQKNALDFLDEEETAEGFLESEDKTPSLASKAIDALKFEAKRRVEPIAGTIDKFKNLAYPDKPDVNEPRRQMMQDIIAPTMPIPLQPLIKSETGEKIVGGLATGFPETGAGMLAAVPAAEALLKIDTPVGRFTGKLADGLRKTAQQFAPNDPTLLENTASGIASMAAFMVPATGAGAVAESIPRMGVLAAKMAPAIGVGVSTLMESATEAGSVFQDMIEQGASKSDASKAAFSDFWQNALLIAATNKLGYFGDKLKGFKKALASAPLESLQEGYQSFIGSISKGELPNWNDVIESMKVGGIIGFGAGAAMSQFETPSGAGEPTPPRVNEMVRPDAGLRTKPAPASFLKDMPDAARNTVSTRYPILEKALTDKPIPMAPKDLQASLTTAVSAGEEVLLRGGTPEEANIAALKAFAQDATPVIKKNVSQTQTNLGRGLTEKPTNAPTQEGISTPKPLPPLSKLEQAREAAQKVLTTNKIDDQVMVKLVDQIAVDDIAFQAGYGKPFKASEYEIQGATYPKGMKDRFQSVIELAEGATEGVGRHEAFHAVSNILLDEAENRIVTARYGDMEKAADAFAAYRVTGQAETPVLQRIFEKIKQFLERIGNYMRTRKFKTADDLFADIEKGTLKKTGVQQERPQYKATQKIEDRALQEFGETGVLKDAGFVFPNGKMVDFTKGTGNRLYSHYDAAEKLTGNQDNLYDLIDETKAVRVVHYSDLNGENISFQSRGPLSTEQLNVIRDYYANNKVRHSNIEIVDGSGHQVRARSIDDPTIEDVSRFFNGSTQYKAVIKPSDSKKDIPKDIYEANRQALGGKLPTGHRPSALEYGQDFGKWIDKFMGSISTRLYNISPALKYALRRFSYDVKKNTISDMKDATDFMGKLSKMSTDDRIDFDLAQKNGDGALMYKLAMKYGFTSDYFKMRNVLNKIHQRARDVGFDVGYLENYFPRLVKDKKGFMKYFMNSEGWSQIKQAIESKEQAIGRILNEDEKVSLINSMIRGYQQGKISLSQLGNMKDRAIDLITPELNQFYYPSNSSLIRYLEKTNELIEARKFFGKGNKELEFNNVDETIGAYTLDLLSKGEITPDQEQELSNILKARFNYQSTGGFLGLYKNIEYLDTLGSVSSAITQIEDLAVPFALHGNINTIKNLPKALRGKSDVTVKDLGLEDIAEEFRDQGKLAKAMKAVFKATGFTDMDRIGKEVTVNAAISKLRREAQNPDALFIRDMGYIFKDKADDVIRDLQTGKVTDDIKFLAFNELLDVQPVDLMEMPQGYLENPNGRILYMLKSFTIKRLDLYRNKIFKKIASNDFNERKEGIANLIKLMATVVFVGAGVDELKDLAFNRSTSLSDRTVDNIAKLFGLNKYTVYKARQEGIGAAISKTIAPPFKIIDSIIKDISHAGDGKGLSTVESVPLVGKLYSNWFGYGAKRTEAKRKKMLKPPSKRSKPKTFWDKSLSQNIQELGQ